MESLNKIPQTSKVWVYQSEKELPVELQNELKQLLNDFTGTWTSHGESVRSAFDILHNRFLVIAIDDSTGASCGRSIDASVRLFKEIDENYKLGFMNRMLTAYRDANGNIHTASPEQLEVLIEKGTINANTLVFNNAIHFVSDLKDKWEIKLSDSWQSRYLKENV